jgi:hypothetical protein
MATSTGTIVTPPMLIPRIHRPSPTCTKFGMMVRTHCSVCCILSISVLMRFTATDDPSFSETGKIRLCLKIRPIKDPLTMTNKRKVRC